MSGAIPRRLGIKSSTHDSGVRLDIIGADAMGEHTKVLHIDYTREQATAVVAGIMRCLGLRILVSDVFGRFPEEELQ